MNRRITGLSSMATRHILADLARDYNCETGYASTSDRWAASKRRNWCGPASRRTSSCWPSKVMASLEAEGHLAKGSIRDFARSEIAIAVPAGSPRPGVESEQAVRQAMLDARADLLLDGSERRSPEGAVREMGRGRLGVGARAGRAARRPRGEPGRARRSRSRFSATERTHGPTRHRDRWSSAAGDPVHNRVLGRRIEQVRGARGRPRSRCVSGLSRDRRRETPLRHGAA